MSKQDRFKTILFKNSENVAVISLDQPDTLNALSVALELELIDAFAQCNEKSDIRAVLLTGSGRAFCAGGDLRKMEKGIDLVEGKRWASLGGKICESIVTLPKPVVAAVNGPAAGGGMNLALACDFVLAADTAYFIASFTRVGLVPDTGGHFLLPRLVGYRKAVELIFTGERIDAQKALAIGMINRVVKQEDLIEKAMATARELAAGPTLAFGLVKEILRKSTSSSLQEVLDLETIGQSIAFCSKDHQEGVRAFREKRPPVFTGK